MEEVNKISEEVVPYSLQDGEQRINSLVEAFQNSATSSYDNGYEQTKQAYDEANINAQKHYAEAEKSIEDQYAIARGELKSQAISNYVNTGLGSQYQLVDKASMQSDLAKNHVALENMQRDIDDQIANIDLEYKNAIRDVLNEGDYQKAQMIYADWETGYDRDKAKAQTMATYGDFSGYMDLGYTQEQCANMRAYYDALLEQQQYEIDLQKAQTMAEYGDYSGYLNLGYTQEQVNNMTYAWSLSNPMMAYILGYIDEDTYNLITKRIGDIYQYNYNSSWYGGGSGDLQNDLDQAGWVQIKFAGDTVTCYNVQDFNNRMEMIRQDFANGTMNDANGHVLSQYERYDLDGDGKITVNDYELNFLDTGTGAAEGSGLNSGSTTGQSGNTTGSSGSKAKEKSQSINSSGTTKPASEQNTTYTGPVDTSETSTGTTSSSKHWWEK